MLKLFRKFGFTKAEILIIAFLVLSFLVGLILKLTDTKKTIVYKSTSADSLLNNQINSVYDSLYSNKLSDEQKKKLNEIRYYSDSLIKANEKNINEQITEDLGGKKLNLNRSYISELMILPGIGENTARKIIEYREEHNGFKSIEELKNVKGIGEKKFNKLKEFISVE